MDRTLPSSGTLKGNFSETLTSAEFTGGLPEFFVSRTGLDNATQEPVATAICSEDPALPTSGTAVGISGVFEIFSLSVGFPELAIAAFVPLLLSGKNGGSILSEVLGVLQDIYR